jgi:small subunit ribosomal protein S20
MATHKSAEKCIRQIARRTEVNGNRIGRIRTFIKKVEAKIDSANQAEARIALVEAEKEIMRGVTKGVLHLNTAARKVSRLSKRVKALA